MLPGACFFFYYCKFFHMNTKLLATLVVLSASIVSLSACSNPLQGNDAEGTGTVAVVTGENVEAPAVEAEEVVVPKVEEVVVPKVEEVVAPEVTVQDATGSVKAPAEAKEVTIEDTTEDGNDAKTTETDEEKAAE